MLIVTGRGKNRKTFEYPCAVIVNRSPKHEQKMGLALLCEMLGVPQPQAQA